MNKSIKPFGMKDKLGYMFGNIANDLTFVMASMFLMVFYTDVLKINAGIVGTMFLVARIVDAFTDTLFSGNQAAVCVMDEWIPDELMQNIAIENNLSETAFAVGLPGGIRPAEPELPGGAAGAGGLHHGGSGAAAAGYGSGDDL